MTAQEVRTELEICSLYTSLDLPAEGAMAESAMAEGRPLAGSSPALPLDTDAEVMRESLGEGASSPGLPCRRMGRSLPGHFFWSRERGQPRQGFAWASSEVAQQQGLWWGLQGCFSGCWATLP